MPALPNAGTPTAGSVTRWLAVRGTRRGSGERQALGQQT